MQFDNPQPEAHYGQFQLDLAVHHVTGSPGGDIIYVWLGQAELGPLVAVMRNMTAEQPAVAISERWRGGTPGWKSMLITKAAETYSAWRDRKISTATGPIQVDR